MNKLELPLLRGEDREKYIPITLIIAVIILIILLILTCLSLTFKKTYKLHYSDSSNVDYKVYLKKNNYYDQTYLGKDLQYISSLINYIDTDFKYNFYAEDDININYSYDITAETIISNTAGKTIYSKEDILKSSENFKKINDKKFSVIENVKIDYNKYNNFAKDFIETYGLTSEAKLVIKLNIKYSGKKDEYDSKISNSNVIKMVIPLTYKTVDISMDYKLSNNKDAVLQYSETVISNKFLFKLSIVCMILEVIATVVIIVIIVKKRDNVTLYKLRLKKIIKDNERYLSETVITQRVEDMLKTQSLRIEVVKSFEGLMDIRDSLHRPILYHEEIKDVETVFYIINDRIGYIYIMNVNDFKKEK